MAQPKHKIKDGVENDQIDETPRVSSVTGQDLVDLFNRLGCPQDLVDGMKGDDLGIYIRNRRARVGVCRVGGGGVTGEQMLYLSHSSIYLSVLISYLHFRLGVGNVQG